MKGLFNIHSEKLNAFVVKASLEYTLPNNFLVSRLYFNFSLGYNWYTGFNPAVYFINFDNGHENFIFTNDRDYDFIECENMSYIDLDSHPQISSNSRQSNYLSINKLSKSFGDEIEFY